MRLTAFILSGGKAYGCGVCSVSVCGSPHRLSVPVSFTLQMTAPSSTYSTLAVASFPILSYSRPPLRQSPSTVRGLLAT